MLETVFTTKPMEFIPPPTHDPLGSLAQSRAESTARLHLLIVDPDSAVRSACAEIAVSLGYAVDSTGDMSQAPTTNGLLVVPGDQVGTTMAVEIANDGPGDFVDYHVWAAQ